MKVNQLQWGANQFVVRWRQKLSGNFGIGNFSERKKYLRKLVVVVTCVATFIPSITARAQSQFIPSNLPAGILLEAGPIVTRQNNIVAFRANGVAAVWDPVAGTAILPIPLAGFPSLVPTAFTPDGSNLFGSMSPANSMFSTPFVWSPTSGTMNMAGVLGPDFAEPVIADFSVPVAGGFGNIVGTMAAMNGVRQAFVAPIGGTSTMISGLMGPNSPSTAVAVDASGNFTVCNGTSALGAEAFINDLSTGVNTPLGALDPTIFLSVANDISSDGSTAVGFSVDSAGSPVAFRWTAATGITSLGTLPGGFFSEAVACNRDGSIVVGFGDDGTGTVRAWIWTEICGVMRDFQTEIIGVFGQANATGWTLEAPTGMSDTGFVTGFGTDPAGNRQVWASQISACWADFDGDGVLTPADTVAFIAAFNSGSLRADGNCDGVLTVADQQVFIQEFLNGC